jgi:hypothetical protein
MISHISFEEWWETASARTSIGSGNTDGIIDEIAIGRIDPDGTVLNIRVKGSDVVYEAIATNPSSYLFRFRSTLRVDLRDALSLKPGDAVSMRWIEHELDDGGHVFRIDDLRVGGARSPRAPRG